MESQIIKGAVNPLDKATIVSIFPFPIIEIKYTIQPSRFEIPSGSYEKPGVLVVGSSSWFRKIEDSNQVIEIPHFAVQVAESIIKDYCIGLLECELNISSPGLFFIPGEFTFIEVLKGHKDKLDFANRIQRRWYEKLVISADAFWSVSNGNPRSISDLMRTAAKELKLDKPWLKDFSTMQLIPCKACGNMNRDNIIVCPNCKLVLRPEEFKKLQMEFAG